jgi:hypothetical protein
VVIDFHTHIYPEDEAREAIAAVKRNFGIIAPETGTLAGLLASMKKAGINNSVLLPVARLPEEVRPKNKWVKSIAREGIVPFGAIHPLQKDLEEELDILLEDGICGVKIVPSLEKIYPDDDRCDLLYESLIEREMIIVFHAGAEPVERGEIFGTPERFSSMTESYPELKVVLTHLGGFRMWDDVLRYLIPHGDCVCFDCAYVWGYLTKDRIAELIRSIGVDHVLFGTDYPWATPARDIELVKGLDLLEDDITKILHSNGEMLLSRAKVALQPGAMTKNEARYD